MTIAERVSEKFNVQLLDYQLKAIEAVLDGKDVFVCTRTGSGKSLINEAIPVLTKSSEGIVVIVAPLLSIMKEQVEKLNSIGLRATYVGKDIGENQEIMTGKFSYVFGSPESFVGDSKWREVLKSDPYRNNLKLIVVDEAHTINLWGEGRELEDPFREWFSKIYEMRSLCPNIPVVALTATAGPTQRRKIIKSLCFQPGYELFIDSPDRRNIKISVKSIRNSDSVEKIFEWLIQDLNQFKAQAARHVIFCESISDVTKVYLAFVKNCKERRANFQMFHSKTSEDVKDLIRKDMSVDGKIRVLVCTNAAGMGVNYYQVHNVVHYGLPKEIYTFVQQMGRGGRDGAIIQSTQRTSQAHGTRTY